MCTLYDRIMSNSFGILRAGAICCQTISDFFNLLFPPATPKGLGALADTSSEGRLSGIYRDLPPVVDRLLLTNFTALFARSTSPPPFLVRPEEDTARCIRRHALKCYSNPGHIEVNFLLLITKNHLIPTGPATHQGTLELDADVCDRYNCGHNRSQKKMIHLVRLRMNMWRRNRRPKCIKPMTHPMGKCSRYIRRTVRTHKPPR
ncbi:hypothetical protein M9H77_25902 [Catharanthus roseus]|uniref:Uncharacterized protein n=1 Tax=Catharanthus roseus TaxID=4058 RepID=A0ACC0A913_CATRO|nr:hypothetical protein M9H77_25902 [Catharanthus roseus]